MDNPILKLDDRTDIATKQMLQGVVKRKRKFDSYEKKHLITMTCSLILAFVYLFYLYTTVVKLYSYSFSAMFSAFVGNGENLYFLIITIGSYGLMNLYKQKMDKAEKEFHALRCEIIDKSKDLWSKEESWNNRHIVFEIMKKHYDINLYHENK